MGPFFYEEVKTMNLCHLDTVLGRLTLCQEGEALTGLYFENVQPPAGCTEVVTPLLKKAMEELTEYLCGERREFTVPLAPKGSPFMKKAWMELAAIPYGERRSYREQAQRLGSPTLCRAVGLANSRNPIPIFLPCHRLVGTDGSLTGFRGGVVMKQWLLDLEGGKTPDTAALTASLGAMRANGGVMPVKKPLL